MESGTGFLATLLEDCKGWGSPSVPSFLPSLQPRCSVPLGKPGGVQSSLSHPQPDPQTDCCVTVGLCRGAGFPRIPQTLQLPPPAPSLLCCHIINRPSWDTLQSEKGQLCQNNKHKLGCVVTPPAPTNTVGKKKPVGSGLPQDCLFWPLGPYLLFPVSV